MSSDLNGKSESSRVQSNFSTEYSGLKQLLNSEIGLIRYTSDIVRMFYKFLELEKRIIVNKGKILDFGSGTGFLVQILNDNFKIVPDCVELDPLMMRYTIEKGFKSFQFLTQTDQDYDVIYTSNTLEHIEDDTEVLSEIFASLLPGGMLGIYVPAHEVLFTQMDEMVGHVRRYAKSELKKKVLQAGFRIEICHYSDSLGFLATLLFKAVGQSKTGSLGSAKTLHFYDKYIFPVSKSLDRLGIRYVVGKNLILIARKP